jgi:hypothetical protein
MNMLGKLVLALGLSAAPLGDTIFADGFESGSPDAWDCVTVQRTLLPAAIVEREGTVIGTVDTELLLADPDLPNSFTMRLDPDHRSLIRARLRFFWEPGSSADELAVRFLRDGILYPWIRIFHASEASELMEESVELRVGGQLDGPSDNFALRFRRSDGPGPITVYGVAFEGTFEGCKEIP